ncbi:D-inositol-3-phosphate glycosyltransferase [Actinocrispum wychmicini]|uniref:D-inositol-3-phosphate glycosyltransferase n=1 Tax=Actinocrispum wychmicini TaxID=1213861 RepID=A0A4R2JXB7_9PSEU|nr:D-inositol-3-phosphate glycosyltransferase [Actinocrispum wychmicini]TCO65201.1 D-inositol-3-phosphate glycosyltransferase [Actinocrispum wychmicini]
MTVWLRPPRRVALLSVHTSPLEQPGTGDAGGMNVYIAQTATRMAERGIAVEVFTRATSSDLPPVAELAPGVLVRHVPAGPFEPLDRTELPAQLCAFTAVVLQTEANNEAGFYDLVHSHYWLSGQVGWLARDRWGVPLVHTAHTLARVKNAALADGDTPEPRSREIGEQQVVDQADQLVANTDMEANDLLHRYDADPAKVCTVSPGVDLARFQPGSRTDARARLGVPASATVFAFVGRIQPLKGPDVLLRAAAEVLRRGDVNRSDLVVLVVGGPSGTGLEQPRALQELAAHLGISDVVRFLPPQAGPELAQVYLAADVVTVPSHNESFGLVALEAQACGTPVVATDVGGLRVAVRDGVTGLLVPGHSADMWADALTRLNSPELRAVLGAGAVSHARAFSWDRTTDELVGAYMRAGVAFREVSEQAEVAS